jgi:hypothetical protein
MKINECLYEGIKKNLTEDLLVAYEVFKEEGYENLEGVILSLNSSKGFGSFLVANPSKLADFSNHVYENIEFIVHLAFSKDQEDEFYPLIEK